MRLNTNLLFLLVFSAKAEDLTGLPSSSPWSHDLEVSYEPFHNWASSVNTSSSYLVVHPKTGHQIASLVTWAYLTRKNVRVQGHQHSYPPLTVSQYDNPSRVVLLDLKRHMTKMTLSSTQISDEFGGVKHLQTITAETGVTMEEFMHFGEVHGVGIVMAPIIGKDATLGGVLAIGGHGAGAPAAKEKLRVDQGFTFGSVSNLIVELKAVVWSPLDGHYVIKKFSRNDPDIGPFLVHLGRAIILEVTLIVGPNYNMRCISATDVTGSELFAHPSKSGNMRTFSKYLDAVGRVDVIWYPFTPTPWLKLWSVEGTKPGSAFFVENPYNYEFNTTLDNPQVPGRVFGGESLYNLEKGLSESGTWDIWGPSKNTILHYNRSATPLVYSGFVMVTSRKNVQIVLHELIKFYVALLEEYGAKGSYPIDQYIKLRVTGLDDPRDTQIPGAAAALLSPLNLVASKPEWNVGIWMNTLTTTRRPGSDQFMRRFEQFAYSRFGREAVVRPEWSKNWGHSSSAPFSNPEFLRETIPQVFGVDEWNKAVHILDAYDPHKVITNRFLRHLMVPYRGPQQAIQPDVHPSPYHGPPPAPPLSPYSPPPSAPASQSRRGNDLGWNRWSLEPAYKPFNAVYSMLANFMGIV